MVEATCPFDMAAIGKAISDSLVTQGFNARFIIIVIDENGQKAIASNLTDNPSKLLLEAAMVLEMAEDNEPVAGHA